MTIVVPGEPLPKERPRVVRKHGKTVTYTPKRTLQAEEALAWALKAQIRKPYTAPLALEVEFHRATHRRVDLDNLMKLVLDAGNRARIWADDSLVRAFAAWVYYGCPDPRTEIHLNPFGDAPCMDVPLRPRAPDAPPLQPAAAPARSRRDRAGRGRASGRPR